MVPPMDSSALAEAVATLLVDDDQHRRYAESGRSRVEEEFDVTKTTRAVLYEMQRASGGARA
jgi:glycosyltransferase involved in cell wall biosynthesis